jgi:hypothetical protein
MVLATPVTSRFSTTPTPMGLKPRGSMPCSCERANRVSGFTNPFSPKGAKITLRLSDARTGHRLRRPRVEARPREAVRFVDVFLSLDAFAVFLAAVFLAAPLRGAGFLARTLRPAFLAVARFWPTLALTPLRARRLDPAAGFSLWIRLAARRRLLAATFLLRRDGRPQSFAKRLAAVFLRDLFLDRLSS